MTNKLLSIHPAFYGIAEFAFFVAVGVTAGSMGLL